ncbi:hypothetical protein E1B28_004580 [Marasmius oreades]|uniref:Uncharacterized protein n=1 Tax=Marasmius oreades TaxID=181124 RepID=A0A9P7UYW2_9AGAR|nr:uncharacterized protein E1B28_004580 [Marasmius oreades]KAG7097209.1 hypothetical protein E1B28_004580 [Marasmius oreades]
MAFTAAKFQHQKPALGTRLPLLHMSVNNNQDSQETAHGSISQSAQLAREYNNPVGKIGRTHGVSVIQPSCFEDTQPPEKRQRLDGTRRNAVAEREAEIYVRHWEVVRYKVPPPQPERSLTENKAISAWLGTYLAERFISDKALRPFVCEIASRDLYDAFDFFQPEDPVIFLGLKYLEKLLRQFTIDLSGRSDADCAIVMVRAYLIAFSLAWKWLDDYVQPLHDWAGHIRLSRASISDLETLALSSLDWRLSITPPEWTTWLFMLQKQTTTMDSHLFNRKSMTVVIDLIGRSLKELLTLYTSDPYKPLPSPQTETLISVSASSRRVADALTAFQRLLTADIDAVTSKRATSFRQRACSLSVAQRGDRLEKLHLARASLSKRLDLETLPPNANRRCVSASLAMQMQLAEGVSEQASLQTSNLKRSVLDPVMNSKHLSIHQWRENVFSPSPV